MWPASRKLQLTWACGRSSASYSTGSRWRRLALASAAVYSGLALRPAYSASRSCRWPLSGSITPSRSQVARVA